MANQNNSAGITDDDIKKAKDYKDAMDALKNSISGVNSKLPEFSEGLQAGLKAIGEKLPEVVDAMVKLNAQNKELATSGQKPKSVLAELASSMFSWNSIVSVGITLLTTYSGAIISWVSELLKGETRLSAFGKAMKDNAIIADALIQARLRGAQSAQGELTALNSLYRTTQDHNVKLAERKKIVNELKDQWPNTFKNLSDEAILTGKASDAYKNLKEQILAAAYAEAYKNKITLNASRALENEQKIAKERENNLKILEQQKKALDNIKQLEHNDKDSFITTIGKAKINSNGANRSYTDELEKQNKLRAASDKIIYNLHSDTKLLNTENDKLADSVEKLTIKYGASVLTGGNSVTKQQQHFKQSATQQTKSLIDDEKAYTDFLTKQLLQTTDAFNKKIELDQSNYTTGQTALKTQLDNKLITQEQYQQQSQQLEEKYHIGVGEMVTQFNKDDLAKAQQLQKDLVDAQGKKEVLNKDEQNIDKASHPGQKLDAEKQLITDKYNYEITLAAGNAEKIKELENKKQQDITQLTQQYEQQRKDFALQTAQQVSDKAFSIIGNNIKSQSDAKIKGLEKDKATELSNKSLTSTQRQAIEAKYQKQEAAEKIKAFKAEQKASILQAVINGALAVTKATSQTGILAPFVIPGIIAATAIQVATIAAQKAPQYAKGGLHYQSDGRGALLPGYSRTDNTNAFLRSGEAVVVSEAMRNPWARNLVSAINVAHGGRDFSAPNTGRGYAIGGIFTDGGNANRYYNQPVNDVKDLANTLAYQMINNFPPIYVDVKDVNNQQNILAQTVNRVNL